LIDLLEKPFTNIWRSPSLNFPIMASLSNHPFILTPKFLAKLTEYLPEIVVPSMLMSINKELGGRYSVPKFRRELHKDLAVDNRIPSISFHSSY
jgi:hypothetical protein